MPPNLPIIGILSGGNIKLLTPTVSYTGTTTITLRVTNNDSVSATANWSWYNEITYESGSGTTTIAAGATVVVATFSWGTYDIGDAQAYMTQSGYEQSATHSILIG